MERMADLSLFVSEPSVTAMKTKEELRIASKNRKSEELRFQHVNE